MTRSALCGCGRRAFKGQSQCAKCRLSKCGCGNSKSMYSKRCLACERLDRSAGHRASVRANRARGSRRRWQRLKAGGASSKQAGKWRRVCERDGWHCWICGQAIDPSLRVPNRWAGTADHVVPLVSGGRDDDANLRAAHMTCNIRRRAWKADPCIVCGSMNVPNVNGRLTCSAACRRGWGDRNFGSMGS